MPRSRKLTQDEAELAPVRRSSLVALIFPSLLSRSARCHPTPAKSLTSGPLESEEVATQVWSSAASHSRHGVPSRSPAQSTDDCANKQKPEG
eukprot:2579932-Rhodomonas_salina.2